MIGRRNGSQGGQSVITFTAIALFAAAAFGLPQASSTTSISEARKLPLGSTITIAGVVTVPSAAFKSGFNDDGFAIQDNLGGIYVSVHQNLNLTVGQSVRVTGKLAETNGQLLIVETEPTAVQALGKKGAVTARKVSTVQIGGQTLGLLVSVTGRISSPVTELAPFGFRLGINDGTGEVFVFVSTSTKISQQGLKVGDRITATGLGGAFKGQYQMYPRFPADVKVVR